MSGTRLLVGTTKGLFLLDAAGDGWTVTGPLCDGWPVNHAAGEGDRLWAAGGSEWFGAGVFRSQDGGRSWQLSKLANGQSDAWLAENPEMAAQFGMEPAAPAPFTGEVDAVWSLALWDGRLLAGTKPATLFASADGGASWEKITGLTDHPTRGEWEPGGAGLTLHTIVTDPGDPAKLWAGISAAGVFASEDGGASWERRVRRSNTASPPRSPFGSPDEIGYCVHNMGRGPGDVLYQQNHHGVYRSRDGGRSWDDITAGLPSSFGFPVGVHREDPDMLWVLPLNGDTQGRYPPGAQAAVWKSEDAGETWRACREGLPQEACYFTVLRQAMAVGPGRPAGVYFGTNTGSVFASADEGESWQEIARHLPTVLCVELAT
ncbi:exo-alpha-sialidase [Poseidonocella sp. HB161398]|uniref:WD40/YVTN/BNR-like repeat-containing protein n=1 Tax=Poseidonocella sp. HB161398 TaxID=2320855 RepID=UPI0011094B05|nr:exo-alpha-sialidase [Poseidonocella sp. HB161398]